jgi:hypothetical protein
MFELFNIKKKVKRWGAGTINNAWESVAPTNAGIITENSVSRLLGGAQWPAAFSTVIPKVAFYFDISISSGYSQGAYCFIGISNNVSGTNWNNDYTNQNVLSWYSGGNLYGIGNGVQLSGGDHQLNAGTYRFAFDPVTMKLYFKRLSPTVSSIKYIYLPTFTGDLRIFTGQQGGYPGPDATTIVCVDAGSGGLY